MTGFSIVALARAAPPFDLATPLAVVTPTRTGTLTWDAGDASGTLTVDYAAAPSLAADYAGGPALTWE